MSSDRHLEIISVAIVEDERDIREAMALSLDALDGMVCVATYPDCESALSGLAEAEPDVVLMDIGLPGMSGIEGVARVRKLLPEVDIIMVTVYQDDARVFDALCAGARGYLTKNVAPGRLAEAIREVHAGGAPMSAAIARMVVDSLRRKPDSPLTPRETEVLKGLCDGLSYKMIAEALFISETTVHTHIKNIYRKLEVHSQTEAVARAFRDRLV